MIFYNTPCVQNDNKESLPIKIYNLCDIKHIDIEMPNNTEYNISVDDNSVLCWEWEQMS